MPIQAGEQKLIHIKDMEPRLADHMSIFPFKVVPTQANAPKEKTYKTLLEITLVAMLMCLTWVKEENLI